jgi:hypothetical protein
VPRSTRHLFTIPRDQLDEMPARSLLDMLRYDGAICLGTQGGPVENNGHYRFEISQHRPPTFARWQSFGITISDYWTE